ncbi:RBBP9/YdeN family alpha/beta hydrolase [Actinacidiphila acididurans]|uniref:Alpha/beta hydrolase n=1 Tax=Actinacidiphila acididurans TaxID=2784346 RepID=A0ABS2TZR7_9ACTN|nr:alpha/beta fold hydrolase [Actinacidiphila acididurans]MBM9507458.1 alpha/beta hydrolase [Actinacidiphila acididurans]
MGGVLISHGVNGSPGGNWYPWLAGRLRADGHEVAVPALPAEPDPHGWQKTIETALPAAPADTVLVGHSLGGVALLRLLQNHDVAAHGPFRGLLLVASMAGDLGYSHLKGFYTPGFDWPRIRAAVRGARVLHAVDDPVTGARVPEHMMIFAGKLGARVLLMPDGGHFPSHGSTRPELPEALRLVRELLG